MIFIKWKQITVQLLADHWIENGQHHPETKDAFDAFSHDQAVQYKAYAVYDAELPVDLTKLLQVCNGV